MLAAASIKRRAMGNEGNAAERQKSHLPAVLVLCVIIWATSNIPSCAAATRNPPDNFTARNDRMENMIQTMSEAGDFGVWAKFLYAMDPAALPMKATFFVLSADALSRLTMQAPFTSSILQYHIVPQQLSSYDLHHLDVGMRLPTLLPNQTIVVTSNRPSNYTLDNVLVTQPDIFYDGIFAIHGVAGLLNFTHYGADLPRPRPLSNVAPAPNVTDTLMPVPDGNSITGSVQPSGSGTLSDAPCLFKEFPVALAAASVVLLVCFSPLISFSVSWPDH